MNNYYVDRIQLYFEINKYQIINVRIDNLIIYYYNVM